MPAERVVGTAVIEPSLHCLETEKESVGQLGGPLKPSFSLTQTAAKGERSGDSHCDLHRRSRVRGGGAIDERAALAGR